MSPGGVSHQKSPRLPGACTNTQIPPPQKKKVCRILVPYVQSDVITERTIIFNALDINSNNVSCPGIPEDIAITVFIEQSWEKVLLQTNKKSLRETHVGRF